MTDGLVKISDISSLISAVTTDGNQTITGNKTHSGSLSAVTKQAGTNTTDVATTAFVQTAVSNIEALPDQTGAAGKALLSDGTDAYWGKAAADNDGVTISENSQSKLQAIGLVNKSGSPSNVYNWVGNYADYVAGRQNGTILDNWLCYITDDIGGGISVYTKTEVDNLINRIEPAGSIKIWAGTTVPEGYLLCDGSAVSRTTYSALFSAIGTTYGAGDSSTTFNLPNLTNKFIEGGTSGINHSAGLPDFRLTNKYSVSGQGASYNARAGYVQISNSGIGGFGNVASLAKTACVAFQLNQSAYPNVVSIVPSNTIYGNSTTVQPVSLEMIYCIKY